MSETQTAPDLSHLSREDRVRIAVVECTGQRTASGRLWWRAADPTEDDESVLGWHTAPDPLTDPAAWGALVEKDGISLVFFGGEWRAFVCTYGAHGDLHTTFGYLHQREIRCGSPGEAVCLRVLAKHGVTVDE